MKTFTLATGILLLAGGACLAQPPQRETEPADRPEARESSPRRGGDREGAQVRQRRRGNDDRPGDRRPDGPPRPGGPGGMMAMFPLMRALDADQNGELSAEEIENATAAIRTLDKNEDGRVDGLEMRPEFPPGGFGRQRFGRPGFGQRPPEGAPERDGDAPQRSMEGVIARLMNYDRNDDGRLTGDELPQQMQSMLTRADRDDDGALDREEITAMARARFGENRGGDRPERNRPDGGDFLNNLLRRFDTNNDERMSSDEAPEFLKRNFDALDTNSDGQLDREELAALQARMRARGDRPRPERDGDPPQRDGERRNRRPESDSP